jgi:hypothetical protein
VKLLNEEEVLKNNAGELSDIQFRYFKKYGRSQMIVAAIFVALIIASVFMTRMKWSWLMAVWIGGGTLFTAIYVYTGLTYLRIPQYGNSIQSVSGAAEIKESGKRHRLLRIGDQSFFLLMNQSAGIENGKSYTVYYLDNPRTVTGWIES